MLYLFSRNVMDAWTLSVSQTMQTVNKRMDPKKTLQTMQDFQKENMKMGMTEDMRKFF